jgi:2OG-Fe(II) oxygenase superfamily
LEAHPMRALDVQLARMGADCAAGRWEDEVDVEVLSCGEHKVLLLRKLVPRDACEALMREMDADPYASHCGYRKHYRDCDRVELDSESLAGALYARSKSVLAREFGELEVGATMGIRGAPEGVWVPESLNPHFRLCRYEPGGHFAPHCDATFAARDDLESQLTFMIYLNGGGDEALPATRRFSRGGTLILRDGAASVRDANRIFAHPEDVIRDVAPETGMAIVFLQRVVLHAGDLVEGPGRKYIFRSDVMFRRTAAPARSPEDDRCLQLIRQAQEAELAGSFSDAMDLYLRAERINRDLFRSVVHPPESK